MIAGIRILIVANARYPIREPFAGGLEAWTWALVRGLRRRGADVTIFAGAGSDPALVAGELPIAPFEISEIARTDVSMPPEAWMREHHAYLQAMLSVLHSTGRFDVVHNSSLHYLPVALADAISTPMVTTLHTPPTPWLESAIALQRSSLTLVAVSEHTAASWAHVAKPHVIRNGIDLASWQIGPGGDALVWSGRIVPEKAPHLAASIAKKAGFDLRIAGPVGDAHYFRTVIQPLLGRQIEYVGHLAHPELANLIGHSAATLVTPAWDEPYGLVVAESLACGTPVCAFARGGIPEILNDNCARAVTPGDTTSAARALADVVALDRSAARRRAEQHCSIERMLDCYGDLYARLMADNRSAA
jgi:glycosyltransferase involved in cell wall biosynthesis